MKTFELIDISGWKGAIIGMRNPKNSWNKNDSDFTFNSCTLGENDLKLATALCKAGTEHRKFLRMIHVQMNVFAPRYVWSEFDTYHFNTKNSCSTRHKLFTKDTPITKDMFVYNENDIDVLDSIIDRLNGIRKVYLSTKDGEEQTHLINRAKAILPEGFIQLRTLDTNYEELRTIYKQRHNHRLKWWREFCIKLEDLPYAKEFIIND